MKKDPRKLLVEKERLMLSLLDEVKQIDARLSTMTPSDPGRRVLIEKKAEVLPRYRGAKQHVKQLRRVVNELPDGVEPVEDDKEISEDVNEEEILEALYEALTGLVKRHHEDEGGALLTAEELEPVEDYLNWREHEN